MEMLLRLALDPFEGKKHYAQLLPVMKHGQLFSLSTKSTSNQSDVSLSSDVVEFSSHT